jgi:putative peptide zinc metalloprotease protein
LFAIVLFIAGEFFVVGVILAIWAVVSQLFLPVAKRIAFVVSSPLLDGRRGQAATVSAVLFMVVAGLLFAVPFPLVTTSEGVVWTPENGEVRAGADGVVVRLIATPNSIVQVGDPLIEIEDPLLPHRVEILEAELAEARSRFEALRTTNPVQADIVKVEMGVIDANLDVARERLASLVIRSPASGVFLIDRPPDWPGQFVRHGDLVAYVADVASGTVRVAVAQEDIGLIRQQTRTVSVRLADRLDETLQANISREVPLASERLPSAALGTTGGGTFVVDPTKTDGVHALQKVFQLELGLEQPVTRIGGRVYVRFDLGSEPLGLQWLRRARQLFLSQFHV